MHLSAQLYHRLVRPRWLTKKYLHDQITSRFSLADKIVLDFGCGTGANCCMCDADGYFGIDLDAKRIQFAKRIYPTHRFTVFDGRQVPLPDNMVDHIFILAVLHHIPNGQFTEYLAEFRRVLKPDGNIIVIEPFLSQKNNLSNWFMQCYDNGAFIRHEYDYLQLFSNQRYKCEVLKKFRKCLVYQELFFTAVPAADNVATNLT